MSSSRMKTYILNALTPMMAFAAALVVPSASASQTQCGLFLGSSCDIPIYSMRLCNQVTLEGGLCEKLCEEQKPICDVEGFAPWVEAFQKKGKKSIEGPLVSQAENFDADGVLAYTSERTVSVCKREVAVLRTGSWKKVTQTTCPKAEVASEATCNGGTVFDKDSGLCETVDASGEPGGADYGELIKQSQLMTATQNQHFGTDPSIDPHMVLSAATSSQLPGLIAPSKAGPGRDGSSDSFSPASKSGVKRSGASSNGMSGSGGMVAFTDGVGSQEYKGSSRGTADSVLASAHLGNTQDVSEGYANGAGTGGGAAGGAKGGLSWFGTGSSSATAGGASGDHAFGKDGDPSRSPASSEILPIEDPANYFMLSDIDVSLFKRVTAACRKKEKSLVLAP